MRCARRSSAFSCGCERPERDRKTELGRRDLVELLDTRGSILERRAGEPRRSAPARPEQARRRASRASGRRTSCSRLAQHLVEDEVPGRDRPCPSSRRRASPRRRCPGRRSAKRRKSDGTTTNPFSVSASVTPGCSSAALDLGSDLHAVERLRGGRTRVRGGVLVEERNVRVRPEPNERHRQAERLGRRGRRLGDRFGHRLRGWGRRGRWRRLTSAGGAPGRHRGEQADENEQAPDHRALLSRTSGSRRPSPSTSAHAGTPGPARSGRGTKPNPPQRQAPVPTIAASSSVE